MMKQAKVIFEIFLTALVLFQGCGDPPAEVIATVNEQQITVKDFSAQWAVLRTVRPEAVLDQRTRKQLMDQMVRQALLVQEAEKRGYQRNPSLERSITQQRDKLRLELNKQISDAQAQLAQLNQAVRSKALIEVLLADYGHNSSPGSKEIEAYYAAQAAKGQRLPPLKEVQQQVMQQILIDRLIKEIQGRYEINVNQSVLQNYASPAS